MKVHRRRRFKFRDAQCAGTTFIHSGALTRGRMKVYYESLAAVRRHRFRDAQCALTTFIHGGALTRERIKVYYGKKAEFVCDNSVI